MFDVDKIREDFPILKQKVRGKQNLVYFDNAATTQKPLSVINSIVDYYTEINSNVHRGVHYLSGLATDEFEKSRQKVKEFINAQSTQEIIFTRGTTESINLVANAFSKTFLSKNDQVIITEMEHHSNIVPWQIARDEFGFTLKYVSFDEKGVLNQEELFSMINENTKLVALTHISNTLGTINPIKEIIDFCHKKNVKVLIDGAQGIAHTQVDVQKLDCDFYCFSGHKIYAPMGVGVMYGKKELLENMAVYQGGGEMIKEVTMEKTTFNELPYKYEAGTPSVADVIGLKYALDYVDKIGMKDIISYEDYLMEYTTEQLQKIKDIRIIGQSKEKSSCISFLLGNIHHLDVGTLLDMQGIAIRTGHHCAEPVMQHFHIEGTDRVSFSFYNTKQEVDIFIKGLLKAQSMLM
ncbi:MAG: cysteine desulfurase [Bacteroidales bacterium]|jgi:cysteine desulfurase/selenocysteine lyase|nr:cysteine desulfurase [Bacteroidales bacterium]